MYQLLLYLHVCSVVVSIGPFFVLIPYLPKMKAATEEQLAFYLDSFRFVIRLSKHAGHVLVATGILLVWLGGWKWSTCWILLTIIILVGALSFFARAFSPTIRKLTEPNHDRTALVQKLSRSLCLYILLMLVMMWSMITKPNFW